MPASTAASLVLGAVLALLVVSTAADSCPSHVSHLKQDDECKLEWKELQPLVQPTQASVGYAWVQEKLESNFNSKDAAQKEMDHTIIPVVLGPSLNGSSTVLYVIDHHHELCALDAASHHKVVVTIRVVCDLSDLDVAAFWAKMQSARFAYLLARQGFDYQQLPRPISPENLPQTITFSGLGSPLVDDPWRSLGSFVRKVTNSTCKSLGYSDTCFRGYIRSCSSTGGGIPFFEFKWAYFFNDALNDETLWPSQGMMTRFRQMMQQLDINGTPGGVDFKPYQTAAILLVQLCRSDNAMAYNLPTQYFGDPSLPGWTPAGTPLVDDPDCNPPTCPF
eukprot:m.225962 g.225962  ORF g.225962 m.225962 type:complete len:334 (-) comp10838_c0_seq3:148-1149(-)